jgi:hypothetical protein
VFHSSNDVALGNQFVFHSSEDDELGNQFVFHSSEDDELGNQFVCYIVLKMLNLVISLCAP